MKTLAKEKKEKKRGRFDEKPAFPRPAQAKLISKDEWCFKLMQNDDQWQTESQNLKFFFYFKLWKHTEILMVQVSKLSW